MAHRFIIKQRVRIKESDDEFVEGYLLGFMYERGDDADFVAVLSLDGHGLFLTTRHPSRVEPIPNPEEPLRPLDCPMGGAA